MINLVIDGTCLLCSQNLREIIYSKIVRSDNLLGDQQHYLYKEAAILKSLIVMSYVFEHVAKNKMHINIWNTSYFLTLLYIR